MLGRVSTVGSFARTLSQFVWFVAALVAVPSLALLGWGLLDATAFARGSVLGFTLGELSGAGALGTVIANGVAFLRAEDMTSWMLPASGVLLLLFAGAMSLLFVLPG